MWRTAGRGFRRAFLYVAFAGGFFEKVTASRRW